MATIKEFQGYELTDGTIVKDRFTAIKMQKEINFRAKLEVFSDKYGTYEGKDQIFNAISNNLEELKEIINTLTL